MGNILREAEENKHKRRNEAERILDDVERVGEALAASEAKKAAQKAASHRTPPVHPPDNPPEWVYHKLKDGSTERIWIDVKTLEAREVRNKYHLGTHLEKEWDPYYPQTPDPIVELPGKGDEVTVKKNEPIFADDDLWSQLLHIQKIRKYMEDPKSWMNQSVGYQLTHVKKRGDYDNIPDMLAHMGSNLSHEGLVKAWLIDKTHEGDTDHKVLNWLAGIDKHGLRGSEKQFAIGKDFDLGTTLRVLPKFLTEKTLNIVGGILEFLGDNWDDVDNVNLVTKRLFQMTGNYLLGQASSMDNPDLWNKTHPHNINTINSIVHDAANIAVDASLIVVVFFIVLKRRIMKIIPNFTRALSFCFGFIYLKRKVK